MTLIVRAEATDNGTVIITAAGQAIFPAAAQIVGAVRAALRRWNPRGIVLDLSGVDTLDEPSVPALIACAHAAAAAGAGLLVLPSAQVHRRLQERGVAELLCIPMPEDWATETAS